MDWTKKRIAIATAGAVVVLGAIGAATEPEQSGTGSGGSAQSSSGGTAAGAPAGAADRSAVQAKDVNEPVATPAPTLSLTVPADRVVYRDEVTVAGRVSVSDGGTLGGVRVRVRGRTAVVRSDGRWSKTITVHGGENTFEVSAAKGEYETAQEGVTITRKRSKAELAAAAAQRRAAAAAKKQAYLASAATIPYNQLKKNADAHAGERVKFTGQIFQIQEGLGSTVILLSVTDEGYGFWTDNVWVDYPGTIKGAEDDVITVYGTIEGSKSYETQIGGETYVPQMTAKYVVE